MGWKRTTAAFIGCLAVAGCGGGHRTGASARHPTPVAGTLISTGGVYRWLVQTEGAQPSVAAENRLPGTTAWRLPGPAADVGGLAHGDVSGYVSREAVRVGQTERIYVSAPGSGRVRIRIFRMGWYHGRGGQEVLASAPLRVVGQPACTHRFTTGLTECRWHPTLSFSVPSALPTGIYIAKLSARTGQADCLFVVLGVRPQPLLAQLPTATYEAYNAWGGDSLYPGRYRPGQDHRDHPGRGGVLRAPLRQQHRRRPVLRARRRHGPVPRALPVSGLVHNRRVGG